MSATRPVGRRVAIHAAATPTADRHIDEPLLGFEPLRWLGGALILGGAAVLLDSFARFAMQGRGTPLPNATRAFFEPRAAAIIAADPPGLMSGDLSRYCFEKLPRPIFPLDDVPEDAPFFRCCKHGTP